MGRSRKRILQQIYTRILLMLEWLDKNGVLIYSNYNKGKSVIAERCIKTIKGQKIYKRVAANDSKCYLSYLSKLVDQYNNTYHHSVSKKPINTDYSAFTEKIETNPKALKFKVNDRVRITKYKNMFSTGCNLSRKVLIINSVLKTNPWTYKIKDFNFDHAKQSSLPNRRVARNKRGGGKDEPFFISVLPGISMMVRIFRSDTVIKKEQNELKFLIRKQRNQKNGTRE